MGLLDQVIGSVLGSRTGHAQGGSSGGGSLSPIAMALIALLASRAMGQGGLGGMLGGGGGLGDVLGGMLGGGGSQGDPRAQDRGRHAPDRGGAGDFAGMLDGPGGAPGPMADAGSDFRTGGYAGAEMGGAEAGGLGGLIERFQRNGLGDVIGSWIGHGQNQSVSPQQLNRALGDDTIDALSRQTGMGRDDLLSELARVLPGVVDHLTPQGRPPSHDEMRHW